MENSILSIIAICISLFSLFITFKNEKILRQLEGKNTKTQKNKSRNVLKEKYSNQTEYLHSLDFNIHLDEMIQPLLGSNTNEEIISKIFKTVRTYEHLDTIDNKELHQYITDVLSNYHNSYNENPEMSYIEEDIEKYKLNVEMNEPVAMDLKTFMDKQNSTNINHVLNNFYSD